MNLSLKVKKHDRVGTCNEKRIYSSKKYRTKIAETRLNLQPIWIVGKRMKFYKANNNLGYCSVCITKGR